MNDSVAGVTDGIQVCADVQSSRRRGRHPSYQSRGRIYVATRPDGLVKVGFTLKTPRQRLAAIGGKLTLVGYILGTLGKELGLHHDLRPFRNKRDAGQEWYEPSEQFWLSLYRLTGIRAPERPIVYPEATL